MTSPGRMTVTSPPRDWMSPMPSVTCRVCPTACLCQAVRAQGANRTVFTRTREGSSPLMMTSNQTSPVNISAGPLVLGVLVRISTSFLVSGGHGVLGHLVSVGLVLGRGPAGEQPERVRGRGACGRRVDEQGEAGVGGELHRLEVKLEVTDDRVVQLLEAGAVEPDVVGGPAGAEDLTAGGELADQLGERLVVRILARGQPEDGGDVVGGAFPVDEEVLRRLVEVDEASGVRGPSRVGQHRC